jgi:hypothetical protein
MESKILDIITIIFLFGVLGFGVFFLINPKKVHDFYNKSGSNTSFGNYMQRMTTPFMYKLVAIGIIFFSLSIICLLTIRIIKTW